MSKCKREMSADDRLETIDFLLKKGVTQKKIAEVVGRSQGGISIRKQQLEFAEKAHAEGCRETIEKMNRMVMSRVADGIADQIISPVIYQNIPPIISRITEDS